MDINIRVDFPALDRLCGILEGKTGAGLCAEVKVDVGGSVDVCAEKGEERTAAETTPVETTPVETTPVETTPSPSAPSAPPGPAGPFFAENYPLDSFPGARTPSVERELSEPKPVTKAKGKTKAETKSEAVKEPVPEPAPEPVPAPAPEPAEKTYVLEDLQRAAASLRDQGKLGAVTALFPEYGIRKLSDLKAEQMAGFAGELKRLGAEL